jgi:hypothetical protein
MTPRQTPNRDLQAEITQALIAAIEKDPGQAVMPWRRTGGAPLWLPENALTNTATTASMSSLSGLLPRPRATARRSGDV